MEPSAFVARLLKLMAETIAALLTKEISANRAELSGLRMWIEDLERIPEAAQTAHMLLAHLSIVQLEQERAQHNAESEALCRKVAGATKAD